MPQGQSSAALAKQYGGTPSSELAKQFGGEAVQSTAAPDIQLSQGTADEHPSWLSSAIDFASGVASQVNPVEMLKGIYGAVTSPIETVKGIGAAQLEQFKQGKKAFDEGRYSEAFGHTMAGALPLVGPAAAGIGEDIGAGNVAHGLGAATGLVGTVLAPGAVKAGVKTLQGSRAAEAVAGAAERGSAARMVDVMAPKVGPNKTRFGNMAKDVAPGIAAEPGMGALSRRGLGEKIGAKLSEAESMLDEANDARNPAELIDTSLVTSGLEEKLRKLTAETAEGPEAQASAAKAGYGPTVSMRPPVLRKFSELAPEYRAEVKRLAAEMEEFQFVDRTWLDRSEEVAREGGSGTGRGARQHAREFAAQESKPFVEGEAGTPVFGEIMGDKSGSRGAVIRALRSYIDEGRPPSPLIQRAITVADRRIHKPESVSPPMLPLEDFMSEQAPDGKLGKSVIPEPNQPRAQAIIQALKEVRALGPMASYDSLRKIRQAWDQPAKARYAPAITPDFMKVQGEAYGAADVTGTLREVLSYADPKTAAANKVYSFWRKADDVVQAANEVERVRPTVGRKIMARIGGTIAGGAAGGTLGEIIGFTLGPLIDSVASTASEGRKIMVSRVLSDVSSALKSGNADRIETTLKRARAISLTTQAAGKSQQ